MNELLDRSERISNAMMRAGSAALLKALNKAGTPRRQIVFTPPPELPRPASPLWPSWYTPPKRKFVSVKELIAAVAKDFDVTYHDIVGRNQSRKYVEPRAVVARILVDRGMSLSQAGRFLARDHSSIMNLIGNYDIYARRNPIVQQSYFMRHEGYLS